jgi:hypothetical protein
MEVIGDVTETEERSSQQHARQAVLTNERWKVSCIQVPGRVAKIVTSRRASPISTFGYPALSVASTKLATCKSILLHKFGLQTSQSCPSSSVDESTYFPGCNQDATAHINEGEQLQDPFTILLRDLAPYVENLLFKGESHRFLHLSIEIRYIINGHTLWM